MLKHFTYNHYYILSSGVYNIYSLVYIYLYINVTIAPNSFIVRLIKIKETKILNTSVIRTLLCKMYC